MTKKFLSFLLVAALFSVVFVSCSKEKDDKYANDYSRGYFPLQFGRYVTYDVDSTLWDDFLCLKSVHPYQMRYTIADTFRDNQNRLSYRMDVHIRTEDSLPWNTHRVIYITPEVSHIEYVEDNVRFIKLVFPVDETSSWQGNSMIPVSDQDYQYFFGWNYRYSEFTKPFNNGKVNFDNTVTVSQADEAQNNPELMPSAYAYKTYSKEVYGYDIGMVYRETTHWIYDPNVAQCRKGYSVVMRAVDHN
jgi:hypothetical protein